MVHKQTHTHAECRLHKFRCTLHGLTEDRHELKCKDQQKDGKVPVAKLFRTIITQQHNRKQSALQDDNQREYISDIDQFKPWIVKIGFNLGR